MSWRGALVGWVLMGASVGAQDRAVGVPLITNYEPEQYKAHSQNWVAVQDRRGVMYFGNSGGILEFDGQHWRLIPVPGNATTRALALGPDGTLFYGSIGDIGYLSVTPTGKIAAVSLKEAIPEADRAFNDVWQVESCRDGIYFLTRTKLFRFHEGRITTLPGKFASSQACVLNGFLVYADSEKGLCLVDGDEILPLPALAGLYDGKRITLLPFGPHELLVGRMSGDFRIADLSTFWDGRLNRYVPGRTAPKDAVRAFPTDVDAFLSEQQAFLYKLAALGSDAFAISTVKAGILVFDRRGKLLRALNKHAGLLDNTVAGLWVDQSRNLWAATNSGLSYIALGTPQTMLGSRNGIDGISIPIAFHKDRIYVGTFQNLYVEAPFRYSLKSDLPGFRVARDSPPEIWDFLETEGDLMACGRGLFRIQSERAVKILGSSSNAYCLGASRRWPGCLFMGRMGGLDVFRRAGGRWSRVGRMEGVTENIRRITEDPTGDLWLSTDAHGLLRVHFEGPEPTRPIVRALGTAEGLPGLTGLHTVVFGQDLYALTPAGLYRAALHPWESRGPERTRFALDRRVGAALSPSSAPLTDMVSDGQGGYFISSTEGVTWVFPGPDGAFQGTTRPFQGVPGSDERIYAHRDGSVWIPGKVVYRVDPRAPKAYDQPFEVLIRKVTGRHKDALFEGTHAQEGVLFPRQRTVFRSQGTESAPLPLPYRQNALAFEFSASFYEKPGTTQFQYLLEGFDKDWSEWGPSTYKEYTNLPERPYRFRVRARNAYGALGREAQYAFRILAPWYRTLWAYLGWLGLGGLGLRFVLRVHTRKLHRQKRNLEGLVAQRTAELVLAKEAAERANAFKSTFLATTTHELRTPLNAILGFSRILVHGEVREAERSSFLQTILGAAESLLQLVNDLLDLNKIEAGKLDVESVPVDLRQILEEALELMGPRARERHLLLQSDVDPAVPRRVLGDPLRIRQMLVNLLGNAVKFTPEGSVRAVMTAEGGFVRVEVQDTGVGIPPEVLPRLFQAFTQGDTLEKNQGTGLGLSITRHLAHLMGGETGVTSVVGGGSRFWFSLPVREAAPDSTPPTLPVQPEGAGAARAEPPLRGRVLLADDNPANRLLAQTILGQMGVVAALVEDGRQAVEAFAAGGYDLVILDANMPELGGVEAMQAIRALPGGSAVPILIFTASASIELRDYYLSAGFDDYLLKPADFDDFRRVLVPRLTPAGLPPKPDSGFDSAHLERLAQAMGGAEALAVFLEELLKDSRARIARLEVAIPDLDRVQVERQAHDLKSNMANLGLSNLARTAGLLETEATEGEGEGLARRFGEFLRGFRAAEAGVEGYLRRGYPGAPPGDP